MRHSFTKEVVSQMEKDKDIFFLTGDLGFNALEPIRDAYPDRFINVGVAEQNMIGVAAGLALTGKKVIAYTIASFLSLRGYEQIRNDVCYHNLDVKLFGPGGGFNYATHGITHHTIEDISIMRTLPNMKVFCPAYAWEAAGATKAALDCAGPTFMRLGLSPKEDYSGKNWKFVIGKGYEIKKGKDIILISTGNLLDVALSTAELIEAKTKFKVSVISMPTVKPLDSSIIKRKAGVTKGVFTIEEHSIIGGLGSAVGEILMQMDKAPKVFKSFGIPDEFIKDVGNRNHLLKVVGLDASSMSRKIISLLEKKRK
jgi:transketolase